MTGKFLGKSTGILFALLLASLPAGAGYQYNGTVAAPAPVAAPPPEDPFVAPPRAPRRAPPAQMSQEMPQDMPALAPIFSDVEGIPPPIGVIAQQMAREKAQKKAQEKTLAAAAARDFVVAPPLVMASPAGVKDADGYGAPVIVAVAPAAKKAKIDRSPKLSQLPATVRLSAGQLVINWTTADDLLAQLERVSQAAAHDSRQLEEMLEKSKNPPRDVATEALAVAGNDDLSMTVAGVIATSLNPLMGQQGL